MFDARFSAKFLEFIIDEILCIVCSNPFDSSVKLSFDHLSKMLDF